MTETTKTVFEKYEIRKTKKQRAAFREYVKGYAEEKGYAVKTEKAMFGAENIIVGDPESAKVVYTAHYDTCSVLPFPNFITPKSITIYLLYQLLIMVLMLAAIWILEIPVSYAVGLLEGSGSTFADVLSPFARLIPFLAIMLLFFGGPANKHTANDNTSGVTLLLDIMTDLPESEREKVAFIFFDLEEMGLFGSAGYASKHKSVAKEKLLLNFDCISDGKNALFVVGKGARQYSARIAEAFSENDAFAVEVAEKGAIYPSDQMNFKRGVGVAALNKTKRGLLYMDKIHTGKDKVYQEENIEFFKNGAIALTKSL